MRDPYYERHKNEAAFKRRRRAYARKYNRKNRKYLNDRMRRYRADVKRRAYERLGNRCVCCEETIKEFLSIDHMHGGGSKERRKLGSNDVSLYFKILRMWRPTTKYRLLCMNCNHAIGRRNSNGVCPHQVLACPIQ